MGNLSDEDRIDALLSASRSGPLFVQGTVANQGHFYPRFDAVILLSAPLEVIFERLRTRTTNDFGKSAEDREKIAKDIDAVEPLLRAGATHEIDATMTVMEIADRLVALIAESRAQAG